MSHEDPELQSSMDIINEVFCLEERAWCQTFSGDELKGWCPDFGDGSGGKHYLRARDCERLAGAFEVVAQHLAGRKHSHPRPPVYTCPAIDSAAVMVEELSTNAEVGPLLAKLEELRELHITMRQAVAGAERLAHGVRQAEAAHRRRIERAAYEAGYRHGYNNGHSDQESGETAIGNDPGDSFDIWLVERA